MTNITSDASVRLELYSIDIDMGRGRPRLRDEKAVKYALYFQPGTEEFLKEWAVHRFSSGNIAPSVSQMIEDISAAVTGGDKAVWDELWKESQVVRLRHARRKEKNTAGPSVDGPGN